MSSKIVFSFAIISSFLWACVQTGGSVSQQRNFDPVCLAQAQLIPLGPESEAKGNLNFEQMPNSMIVIYRLEGLAAKNNYEIRLLPSAACEEANLKDSQLLYAFKTNPQGISENTFKLENHSV